MVINQILRRIIRKHNIKHGDLVNINTLKYICKGEYRVKWFNEDFRNIRI